jgi:hypothetical protein
MKNKTPSLAARVVPLGGKKRPPPLSRVLPLDGEERPPPLRGYSLYKQRESCSCIIKGDCWSEEVTADAVLNPKTILSPHEDLPLFIEGVPAQRGRALIL